MSACAVKRGILTLRDCGEEGKNTCGVCGRPICAEHTKLRSGDTICVECYAREEESQRRNQADPKSAGGAKARSAAPRAANDEEWNDPIWPYTYRHYYYSTSSYQPFYDGVYYDDYYDDYDVRSFTQGGDAQLDDESAAAGGFYDS